MLEIHITAKDLNSIAKLSVYSAKEKDVADSIKAIHITASGQRYRAFSTNRYVIAELQGQHVVALPEGTEFEVTIRTPDILRIAKALEKETAYISISTDADTGEVKINGEVVSSLPKFPPVDRLLPAADSAQGLRYSTGTDWTITGQLLLDARFLADLTKLSLPGDTKNTIHGWTFSQPVPERPTNQTPPLPILATRQPPRLTESRDAMLRVLIQPMKHVY